MKGLTGMSNAENGLKDIAMELGVSLTAVSRALKNESDISIALRKKVWKKAVEKGYMSPTLRKAGARRNNSVAVLVDSLTSPFFGYICQLLIKDFNAAGRRVLIIPTSSPEAGLENVSEALEANVEGIVSLITFEESAHLLARLNRLPILLFGRYSELEGISDVYLDDEEGGRLAVDYLLSRGKGRKLVYLSAPLYEVNSRRERGFLEEAKAKGAEGKIVDSSSYEEAIPGLLREGYRSFFCFDDQLAAALLSRLNGQEDVKVIGFNGDSRYYNHPFDITSIEGDYPKMSARAVEELLSLAKGGENHKEVFPVRLYLGKR